MATDDDRPRRPSSSPPHRPVKSPAFDPEGRSAGGRDDSSPASLSTAPTGVDDNSDPSPSHLSESSVLRYPPSQGTQSPYYHSQAPSPNYDSISPGYDARSPASHHYGAPQYAYHNRFYAPQYLYSPPAQDPQSLAQLIGPMSQPHPSSPPQHQFSGVPPQPYGNVYNPGNDQNGAGDPPSSPTTAAAAFEGYYYPDQATTPAGMPVQPAYHHHHHQQQQQQGAYPPQMGGMGLLGVDLGGPSPGQPGWPSEGSGYYHQAVKRGSASVPPGAANYGGGYPYQSFQASGMPGSPYSVSSGASFGYAGGPHQHQGYVDAFSAGGGAHSRDTSHNSSLYGYHPHPMMAMPMAEGYQGGMMGMAPQQQMRGRGYGQQPGRSRDPTGGMMGPGSSPGPGGAIPTMRSYSPGLSSPMSGPSPAIGAGPPDALARGSLAQAKLHDQAYNRTTVASAMRGGESPRRAGQASVAMAEGRLANRQGLPRPPAHSEYALWVGNVPNDASHEELWQFFCNRPAPPSLSPSQGDEDEPSTNTVPATSSAGGPPPTNSAGVESIHLISRSNCAFVNYSSQRHLDHAISLCHGQALRPLDNRCKPLVCRVRKKDDNVKSGVGAQRIGGMHRGWIEQQQHRAAIASGQAPPYPVKTPIVAPMARRLGEVPAISEPQKRISTGTAHSASTSSTTSSFLTRYFPKRFFILKVRLLSEQSMVERR